MNVGKIILALVAVIALISGCAPRGESKSVSELLTTAKAAYGSASKDGVPPESAKLLGDLTTSLTAIEKPQGVAVLKQEAKKVAETLSQLTEHAGYTQRAQLTEISTQYKALAESAAPEVALLASSKLLMSRTYMLLAAELGSMKFKVS